MFIVLIFFLQSFLFALFHLNIRKLEENGVSAHSIAGLQRYSIIPAIILFIITYKTAYVSILLANPVSFWWIAGIAFFWGIAQFIGYIVLNSASSLSFVYTIGAFMGIPIYLAMGILINHDFPNLYALIALGLLAIALFIRPTQNIANKRHLLKYSVMIVTGLVLASTIGHALTGAFYKNVLHLLSSTSMMFGISIYILVNSIVLNIIYLFPFFKKPSQEEKQIIKKYYWTAFLIPVIWFVASLPEGYSFAHLPLFTLSALGAFSFLIKMVSDIKNKRLKWNLHTALFTSVVIVSIIFSTLSLR